MTNGSSNSSDSKHFLPWLCWKSLPTNLSCSSVVAVLLKHNCFSHPLLLLICRQILASRAVLLANCHGGNHNRAILTSTGNNPCIKIVLFTSWNDAALTCTTQFLSLNEMTMQTSVICCEIVVKLLPYYNCFYSTCCEPPRVDIV